jgi:hypothetical protein
MVVLMFVRELVPSLSLPSLQHLSDLLLVTTLQLQLLSQQSLHQLLDLDQHLPLQLLGQHLPQQLLGQRLLDQFSLQHPAQTTTSRVTTTTTLVVLHQTTYLLIITTTRMPRKSPM